MGKSNQRFNTRRHTLSSFLFTIASDVLRRMLLRGEKSGFSKGFLVDRSRTRAWHLQYADDTIFFSRAYMEDLQNIKLILLVFGHISRLKINLDKSTLTGIPMNQNQTTRLALMLKYKVFDWPLSYLGLP